MSPFDTTACRLELDLTLNNGPSRIEVKSVNGEIMINYAQFSGLQHIATQLPDPEVLQPLIEWIKMSPFKNQMCHIQFVGKTVTSFELFKAPLDLKSLWINYFNSLL